MVQGCASREWLLANLPVAAALVLAAAVVAAADLEASVVVVG